MKISFLRKQNKKTSRRDGRARLWMWAAVAMVCAVGFLLYREWPWLARVEHQLQASLVNHPYFSVREIQVRGGENVGGSEIVTMAGLSHGMSLWKIDSVGIEKKIAKHPWVQHVLVRREFPHRVVIEVQERSPKAIVAMGKLYYVDSEGYLFKEVGEGEKSDFPLLTGLTRAELAANAYSTRQKIGEALRLAGLMAKASLAPSEIRFDPAGGVTVYPMAHPVALQFGWGDWESKLGRLQRILEMWNGREGRLAILDLSYRDQVVARLRKAKG